MEKIIPKVKEEDIKYVEQNFWQKLASLKGKHSFKKDLLALYRFMKDPAVSILKKFVGAGAGIVLYLRCAFPVGGKANFIEVIESRRNIFKTPFSMIKFYLVSIPSSSNGFAAITSSNAISGMFSLLTSGKTAAFIGARNGCKRSTCCLS